MFKRACLSWPLILVTPATADTAYYVTEPRSSSASQRPGLRRSGWRPMSRQSTLATLLEGVVRLCAEFRQRRRDGYAAARFVSTVDCSCRLKLLEAINEKSASRYPFSRRKPRAASRTPTSTQRRIIVRRSSVYGRATARIRPFMFSTGFVVERTSEECRHVEAHHGQRLRVLRGEDAALGCFYSEGCRARLFRRRLAVDLRTLVCFTHRRANVGGRSSGRWPMTIYGLCEPDTLHENAFPTLQTDRKSLLPSMTRPETCFDPVASTPERWGRCAPRRMPSM